MFGISASVFSSLLPCITINDESLFINFSCVWSAAITILTVTSDCQYIILLIFDCETALFL